MIAIRTLRRGGVSAPELIVAVIVLGLVAVISIPRFGQAATRPADNALRGQLRTLRLAIERYRNDHGANPGAKSDGMNAEGTMGAFVSQLTRYSDSFGATSETRDHRYCFGPYLKQGVPPCVVAADPGSAQQVVAVTDLEQHRADARVGKPLAGWVYDAATGEIRANSNDVDAEGRRYDSY